MSVLGVSKIRLQGICGGEKQKFAWKGSSLPAVHMPLASRGETKLVTGGTWRQGLWAPSGCMEVSRREDRFLRTPWRLVPGESVFVDSLTNILINNWDTHNTGTDTLLVEKLSLTKKYETWGSSQDLSPDLPPVTQRWIQ